MAMTFNNQNILIDIFQKLYPKPHDFVTSKRFFIREGDLLVYHSRKQKKVIRHFFLFNDRLLVTKQTNSSFTKHSDWLKIDVSLRARDVDIENMKTASHNNEFRLHLPGRVTYLIYARTTEEKDAWCDLIKKSIKGEHKGDKKKKKDPQKSTQTKKKKEKNVHEIVINESESSRSEDIPRNKSRKEPVVGGTYTRTKSDVTNGRSLVRRKNHNPSGVQSPPMQKIPSVAEIFLNQPEKQPLIQLEKEEKSTSPNNRPVSPNRKGRTKKTKISSQALPEINNPGICKSMTTTPVNPADINPFQVDSSPFTLNPTVAFPQTHNSPAAPTLPSYNPSVALPATANPFTAFTVTVPQQESPRTPPQHSFIQNTKITPQPLSNSQNNPFLAHSPTTSNTVPNNIIISGIPQNPNNPTAPQGTIYFTLNFG